MNEGVDDEGRKSAGGGGGVGGKGRKGEENS